MTHETSQSQECRSGGGIEDRRDCRNVYERVSALRWKRLSLDEKNRIDTAIVLGPVFDIVSIYQKSEYSRGTTYTLVTWAHLPQTTFPLVVTSPSSETLTSIMVPLVRTPSWVYSGFWGFFLTERMGSCTVTPNSGL